MPSTEGYRYGYDNYRKLRSMGFSADEIEKAACAMTKAIRAEYPDRPTRYLPHAERLLNPETRRALARTWTKSGWRGCFGRKPPRACPTTSC